MRILLVDDDEPTRLICRRFLARLAGEPLDLEEAADGAAAMERLRSTAYDGILCDHRMGTVSGVDVLAFARERQPGAFRALMTGFADPSLVEAARARAAVDAFIEKPMTSREFEDVLQHRFLEPMMEAKRPGA
jgi:CheY-like chemotaxis protein